MGSIYKRGKMHWIKYYRNGKPYRESTKSTKESDAKRLLKKREGEIGLGKLPGIYFDRVTFDELAEDFLRDYRLNQKKSLRRAMRSVKNLTDEFEGTNVPGITTPRIEAYIEKRMAYSCNKCHENFEAQDIRMMDKYIRTILLLNEAVSLLITKPLYSSICHRDILLL